VCIEDFEKLAHEMLDQNALDYYKSGADSEETLRENKKAFNRWIIRPRMLRDVSTRNLTKIVLGKPVAYPLGVSPTAMQKLAHEDGECGNARAAAAMNTIFILSTISTTALEDVAAAAPNGRRWFQLYVYNDREVSKALIRRAEACGFEALVLTVDAPRFGKRRANIRNKFVLPRHLSMANFEEGTEKSDGMAESRGGSALNDYVDQLMDQSLTWEDVDWLKSVSRLPIIIKGIMTAEDARLAIQHGASAVFVSNHGGRQVDTVSSTIDVLDEIVNEVKGRCEIYLDGGVYTGSAVFKALALGADMVFAGRPFLWGLTVGGEAGAKKIHQIIRDELDLTMALSGVAAVSEIDRTYIGRASSL